MFVLIADLGPQRMYSKVCCRAWVSCWFEIFWSMTFAVECSIKSVVRVWPVRPAGTEIVGLLTLIALSV